MQLKKLAALGVGFILLFGITACGEPDDNGGGVTPGGDEVAADTAAPVIVLGNMDDTLKLGSTLTVAYTVTDDVSSAADIYVEVKILNESNINVAAQTYTASTKAFKPVSVGEYTVKIEAYDEAGNSSSVQHKVTVTADAGTLDPDDPINPITAISFGNTTSGTYAGVRTKFYAAVQVTGNETPTVTARLLRGNSVAFASEVQGAIEDDVFTAKTTGRHWLEITASCNGHTLTASKQIDVSVLEGVNSLYSFTWNHNDTLDYSAFTVGDKYLKFEKSSNVPTLTYAFDGSVKGSYTLDLALNGLKPDIGNDTASHAPMFSAAVLTGESREDVFSLQVNGGNVHGKYVATNFKEGGNSFVEEHYAVYQITEDITASTTMSVNRYGKNYTVQLNDAVKAERRADTVESAVMGVAFSTTGAIGEVTNISLVKDADPNEEIAEYTMPSQPTYRDLAVHDPSVFKDPNSDYYYAFGSHFAVAKSEDLMAWENVGTGASSLYGTSNWTGVLAQAHAYVSEGVSNWSQNTWAPDVEYYNGKYYMYFSLTSKFGSSKSFIGRVVSDSIEGPYSNEVEIVKSAGNDGGPNAIDPELFYDKTGDLWLVYGSFFGGIYMKKLYNSGENWGLPMSEEDWPENAGYGKKVWAGGSDGPEGPYVFYNEETDYYYLMASYGDLSTVYNMRVARSKNPNGPFVDITGKDMATSGGGNKLAGNYQFADDTGYAALGHNSVIKVDGKYLCVFHTRFRNGTGNAVTSTFSMRVHQLFFNEGGWPVMSPARYAQEETGKVTANTAQGSYDLIVHTSGTSQTFVESTRYTFDEDGTIRIGSTEHGKWEIKENYYITITLDGVAYYGVIAPSWCNYRNKAVLTITDTSNTGVPLWANHT